MTKHFYSIKHLVREKISRFICMYIQEIIKGICLSYRSKYFLFLAEGFISVTCPGICLKSEAFLYIPVIRHFPEVAIEGIEKSMPLCKPQLIR